MFRHRRQKYVLRWQFWRTDMHLLPKDWWPLGNCDCAYVMKLENNNLYNILILIIILFNAKLLQPVFSCWSRGRPVGILIDTFMKDEIKLWIPVCYLPSSILHSWCGGNNCLPFNFLKISFVDCAQCLKRGSIFTWYRHLVCFGLLELMKFKIVRMVFVTWREMDRHTKFPRDDQIQIVYEKLNEGNAGIN